LIHEHAHPDNRERPVLLALPILPQVIRYLYFEEGVREAQRKAFQSLSLF
jgi:hypothetical protein